MRRIRARPPPRRPRHRCAAAPGSSSTGTPAASAAGRGRSGTLPAVAETAAPTAAGSAPEAAPAAAAPSEVPTTDPMTLALPTVPPFRCLSRLSVASLRHLGRHRRPGVARRQHPLGETDDHPAGVMPGGAVITALRRLVVVAAAEYVVDHRPVLLLSHRQGRPLPAGEGAGEALRLQFDAPARLRPRRDVLPVHQLVAVGEDPGLLLYVMAVLMGDDPGVHGVVRYRLVARCLDDVPQPDVHGVVDRAIERGRARLRIGTAWAAAGLRPKDPVRAGEREAGHAELVPPHRVEAAGQRVHEALHGRGAVGD